MWLLNRERDNKGCDKACANLWSSTEHLFSFYKIVDNYYYKLVDLTIQVSII